MRNITKNTIQGSLMLIGATVIWGNAFIAQKVSMDSMGPFTFQALRCLLACLFLLTVQSLLDLRSHRLSAWLQPELWKVGTVCGIALFTAASLQQIGLQYTDAGKSGFITAMYIILVPLFGCFVHRKPGMMAVISVAIAVIGLYLLCCTGNSGINIGDLLTLGCAFAFAVQILLVDRFAPGFDGMRLNCIQALVTAVLSSAAAFIWESTTSEAVLESWLPLFFAGIMSMGVAYTLQIEGQKRMEPTSASLLMSTESVFAALGGWLLLHEKLTSLEFLGCLMVFSAILISQISVPSAAE